MALKLVHVSGSHFRRQVPIGVLIADFACHKTKLIVELDGGQHTDDEAVRYDEVRTAWLATQGYRVLRFQNPDVIHNLDGGRRHDQGNAVGDRGGVDGAGNCDRS